MSNVLWGKGAGHTEGKDSIKRNLRIMNGRQTKEGKIWGTRRSRKTKREKTERKNAGGGSQIHKEKAGQKKDGIVLSKKSGKNEEGEEKSASWKTVGGRNHRKALEGSKPQLGTEE